MGAIGRIAASRAKAVSASLAGPLRRRRVARDSSATEHAEWTGRGRAFGESWAPPTDRAAGIRSDNPLRAFFDARREGRGIWKWDHYFDIYERHFERLRGGEVHVLEIGIFSGGSLEMWHEYFGPECRVYGVDVEAACTRYEDESTRVFIGDQADREFWRRFRAEVPKLDVVIDDGGHQPTQQAVTLEELLPHIRPGGVYLCEDVHGSANRFASYVAGLVQGMNDASALQTDLADAERRIVSATTGFQSLVDSIHHYPFAVVIEKRRAPLAELVAPKRGTEWEPFLG